MKVTAVTHRRRLVKGWAFMDLTDEERDQVRHFLETGERDDLPKSWRARYDRYVEREGDVFKEA